MDEATASTEETPASEPLDTAALGAAVDELNRKRASAGAAPGDGLPTNELLAVLPAATGSPGFVVDEAEARATPCTEYDLGEGETLTFSEGVLGTLDAAQVALYCPETVKEPLTEEQQQRARQFKEAGDACGLEVAPLPLEERISPWLKCMSKEAQQRGVKL
jgi:hypothetical protein